VFHGATENAIAGGLSAPAMAQTSLLPPALPDGTESEPPIDGVAAPSAGEVEQPPPAAAED
jgi:hypothetical protein